MQEKAKKGTRTALSLEHSPSRAQFAQSVRLSLQMPEIATAIAEAMRIRWSMLADFACKSDQRNASGQAILAWRPQVWRFFACKQAQVRPMAAAHHCCE